MDNTQEMSCIGLGTYSINDKQTIKTAIIDLNYRLLDCASMYKNEEMIGEALSEVFIETEIQRKDMFIISKIWLDEIEDVESALRRSLNKLKVDQLDLYLVHWPIATRTIRNDDDTIKYERINIPMYKVWEQMEIMVQKGLTKHIGISNFSLQMTWDMLSYCKIKPYANEIELNPLIIQSDLVRFLIQNGIKPIAYCPIARGVDTSRAPNLFENDIIVQIAQKYNVQPAQVLLNWGIQRGHIVIPKSNSIERLKQNIESGQFKLDQQDVDLISQLNTNHRICAKYDFFLGYNIFS